MSCRLLFQLPRSRNYWGEIRSKFWIKDLHRAPLWLHLDTLLQRPFVWPYRWWWWGRWGMKTTREELCILYMVAGFGGYGQDPGYQSRRLPLAPSLINRLYNESESLNANPNWLSFPVFSFLSSFATILTLRYQAPHGNQAQTRSSFLPYFFFFVTSKLMNALNFLYSL